MGYFSLRILRGIQAVIGRNAGARISVLTSILAASTLLAVAQTRGGVGQRGQTETPTQAIAEKNAELIKTASDQACQAAHTNYPAPQNFKAATMPSSTFTGIANLTWTPVSGLNSSVSYWIQYEVNGAVQDVSATVPYNAASFADSKLPVFYPLKFSISTLKIVPASTHLATGAMWSGTARCRGQVAYSNPPVVVPTTSARLTGFVDLHTHPVSNLAFGGKLIYGGVDMGALLPAGAHCSSTQASSEQEALGYDKTSHGGWGTDNGCGDDSRRIVIHQIQLARNANDPGPDAHGYPDFTGWPKWNDVTHQKMWVNWIYRAYQSGLRVMVALATNNKSLGDITAGHNDWATDDKTSADLQIAEIQALARRHPEWMEVAYSSPDVYRIVAANKLAVIVGIEVDHIGNFQVALPNHMPDPNPPSDAAVKAEIDRLYNEGVRYIFPIHLLDNAFGGAATSVSDFNTSNQRESGHQFFLICADPLKYPATDADLKDHTSGGFTYNSGGLEYALTAAVQIAKTGWAPQPPSYAACPPGIGQKNSLGLTRTGSVAIQEMMRLGMLIDIDHMSQAAADQTLQIAGQAQYPVNSGHNGLRGALPTNRNERALRPDQYRTIGKLHGMAGVGSAELNAQQWLTLYQNVIYSMQGGAVPFVIPGAFGTDMNGLEKGMPHRGGSSLHYVSQSTWGARMWNYDRDTVIPQSTDGNMIWNYDTDGVAHYGMLWDFLQDVRTLSSGAGWPTGQQTVDSFMTGADYFFHTWQIAEAARDRNLGARPHE